MGLTLQGFSYFDFFKRLNQVTHFQILVVGKAQSAFIAEVDFLDFFFKAFQSAHFTGINDNTVANQSEFVATFYLAFSPYNRQRFPPS